MPDSSLSSLGLPNIKERSAVYRWSSFLLPINSCASFVHASHVLFSAWDPNRDDRGRVSPMQMCSTGATPTKFSHYYLGFTIYYSGREQCLKNATVSHKTLKIVLNTYQTPIKWRDVGSFGFNSMAFCKV